MEHQSPDRFSNSSPTGVNTPTFGIVGLARAINNRELSKTRLFDENCFTSARNMWSSRKQESPRVLPLKFDEDLNFASVQHHQQQIFTIHEVDIEESDSRPKESLDNIFGDEVRQNNFTSLFNDNEESSG